VAGVFNGAADLGAGTVQGAGLQDGFVVSYTLNGARRWAVTWGGSGNDAGEAVSTDGDGGVATAGSFRNTAFFEGRSLTSAGGTDAATWRIQGD
jgi:hypothetical protein